MKVLLLPLLLLLLLCSTQVLTLRCYTCEDENDTICKKETQCDDSAHYCRTSVHHETLSRTCEVFCAEDYFTTCCKEDLCYK
ncbi:lymphocyte antigen 6D [Cololabis saira]|uniref:lymphocyte antigen 6D n=1 Tax=Cololabis saira TaxID=129043 RepID=UPI002AD20DA5|nr:lymphocyte antigen 6D [Cololabis saira]